MDGVRGYWNGDQLMSRHGNDLRAPKWFIQGLPTEFALDGELWMGMGTTHENIMTVLKSKNGDWNQIGYHLFDIPSSFGTYEERMKEMEVIKFPPHVHVVEPRRCKGTEHMYEYLGLITAAKGEGIMLREPLSKYDPGYTTSLLKVKAEIFSCTC